MAGASFRARLRGAGGGGRLRRSCTVSGCTQGVYTGVYGCIYRCFLLSKRPETTFYLSVLHRFYSRFTPFLTVFYSVLRRFSPFFTPFYALFYRMSPVYALFYRMSPVYRMFPLFTACLSWLPHVTACYRVQSYVTACFIIYVYLIPVAQALKAPALKNNNNNKRCGKDPHRCLFSAGKDVSHRFRTVYFILFSGCRLYRGHRPGCAKDINGACGVNACTRCYMHAVLSYMFYIIL